MPLQPALPPGWQPPQTASPGLPVALGPWEALIQRPQQDIVWGEQGAKHPAPARLRYPPASGLLASGAHMVHTLALDPFSDTVLTAGQGVGCLDSTCVLQTPKTPR